MSLWMAVLGSYVYSSAVMGSDGKYLTEAQAVTLRTGSEYGSISDYLSGTEFTAFGHFRRMALYSAACAHAFVVYGNFGYVFTPLFLMVTYTGGHPNVRALHWFVIVLCVPLLAWVLVKTPKLHTKAQRYGVAMFGTFWVTLFLLTYVYAYVTGTTLWWHAFPEYIASLMFLTV